MKDIGHNKKHLGINVQYDQKLRKINMNQDSFVNKFLEWFYMSDCKKVNKQM